MRKTTAATTKSFSNRVRGIGFHRFSTAKTCVDRDLCEFYRPSFAIPAGRAPLFQRAEPLGRAADAEVVRVRRARESRRGHLRGRRRGYHAARILALAALVANAAHAFATSAAYWPEMSESSESCPSDLNQPR